MTSSPTWHIRSDLGGRPRIRAVSIMPRRGPGSRRRPVSRRLAAPVREPAGPAARRR